MLKDPLLGRKLANYRLERMLGRGGMGQVYYAWDEALDRAAAIKMLDGRYRDHPAYAERFVNEAKALARWRHEHIVQIYFAGIAEDEDDQGQLYYYAMEYVAGADLAQVLSKYSSGGRLMPHDDVLHLGEAVADALDFAHSQGVIHRDVKPANVLIDTDGRVVLSDFGLAMDVAQTEVGHVVGSPRYTAPEQARHSAATVPASDLYSLGIMLYEMLVGRVPFDDLSATSVAVQHVTQPPPAPRSLNPALNTAVEDVLLKALSKNPKDRYRNGRELMQALARALKGARRQADELLGQQLDEYQLAELLGQGGMARIYRGYDVRLKRSVAIKVIDATYQADADYRARFEREAQAIAQLEHPHIVSLYRYGEVSGLFYMAMQYVEGRDLRSHLAAYRARAELLPAEEAASIIRQVCEALDYAHSKGIIHRDVKPSNIMLDAKGQAYLTDFGLAMLADSGTKGEIFGSPHYIAPEQAISSAGAVPQSDLYAIGVIMYEMFTGSLPFEGKEPLEIAMKHLSEDPRPPHEIRPDMDMALEGVILMALAKKPRKRPLTGEELADSLERILKLAPEPASILDRETAVITPLPPAATAAPISEKKRDLPPIPAAVVIRPQQTITPSSPTAETALSKAQSGSSWRSCLGFLMIVVSIILLALLVSGVFVNVMFGVSPASVQCWTTNVNCPPTAVATITPSPSATQTPTPTTEPSATATAVPSHTPQPIAVVPEQGTLTTETETVTAVASQTHTPSVTVAATQTPTPSQTPTRSMTRERDGMPMVQIPATTFLMGVSEEDPLADGDEYGLHEVALDSFYIDLYEVSVAQYAEFLNELEGYVGKCNGLLCLATHFETISSYLNDELAGYLPRSGFENYPINNVTWHGADAYCQWVGGRLPTEAEWELAAAGGNGRLYPWGDAVPTEQLAAFGEVNFTALQAVDSHPEGVSLFGLFNMAGNVKEWVQDGYDIIYYTRSPRENPTGPATNAYDGRVLRGGGYRSPLADLRTTHREWARATQFQNIPDVGFRCVLPVADDS